MGQVLPIIYVNYLTEGIASNFKAFVVDYKLFLQYPRNHVGTIVDNVAQLQKDLN